MKELYYKFINWMYPQIIQPIEIIPEELIQPESPTWEKQKASEILDSIEHAMLSLLRRANG